MHPYQHPTTLPPAPTQFMMNVDLTSCDVRMKEAIDMVPVFGAEMKQIAYLARKSTLYMVVHHNLTFIKYAMYDDNDALRHVVC